MDNELRKKIGAAESVHSAWRLLKTNRTLQEQTQQIIADAAVPVQAAWRGVTQRRVFKKQLQEAREADAAVLLQAA